MDVDTYLRRIGYYGPRQPTADTLRRLHAAHLTAVPFENLDIVRGQPIVLDDAAIFDKIVTRRRGGFCYELNGLFARLLEALGFSVRRLSARVHQLGGGLGIEDGHMALLVSLEEPWLTDVGFGRESAREPLRLNERAEQTDGFARFRVDSEGDVYTMLSAIDGTWVPQYEFTLAPRALRDFRQACEFQQQVPLFRDRRICSRATPKGRLTVSNSRLIVTRDGQREEQDLADEREVTRVLRDRFGIEVAAL